MKIWPQEFEMCYLTTSSYLLSYALFIAGTVYEEKEEVRDPLLYCSLQNYTNNYLHITFQKRNIRCQVGFLIFDLKGRKASTLLQFLRL
mmetsp:Transcript_26068/g.51969  ORF Transcript_26068/g.51969 Transcript_26068/m.51969 type:complete len:89 (+) Transcript_26068:149-415(+)